MELANNNSKLYKYHIILEQIVKKIKKVKNSCIKSDSK